MQKKPTLAYILDTRSIDNEGYGTIKVRVTYNRVIRPYTTGFQIHKDKWSKLEKNIDQNGLSTKIKDPEIVELYNLLYIGPDTKLEIANKIINHLGDNFSFEGFKFFFDNPEKMNEKKSDQPNDLITSLKVRAEELYNKDQVGTSVGYIAAANSLLRFLNSLDKSKRLHFQLPLNKEISAVKFENITSELLEEYENWMQLYGKVNQSKDKPPTSASMATIGVYLRYVRARFNAASTGKQKIISKDINPFDEYTIPSTEGSAKTPVSKVNIKKIFDYKAEIKSLEHKAWSFWLFSYFGNGMNVSDICRIKYENIDFTSKIIVFFRRKTIRTTKGNVKSITAILHPIMEETIKIYGNIDKSPDSYIFPFINDKMTEKRKKEIISQLNKTIRKYMEIIGAKLGIDARTNPKQARSSFATNLLKSEVPVTAISKLLGHARIKTTENYLGKYEPDEVKKIIENLI